MSGSAKVTYIIPTLNAASVLGDCLRSIRNQDYPADLTQVLVVDGGSKDRTREIAIEFGATVIDNPFRVAESGKKVAMAHAGGDFIVFVDADNEITSSDFVRLAVTGLEKYPKALGVESYYPASAKMSSFCKYLTETIHIGDPISWVMSVRPVLIGQDSEIERWTFPPGSFAYPLGANGFVFRKSDLNSLQAEAAFEDTNIALRLALDGKREWLRAAKRGVHHYLVRGIRDFIRKRRRQTYHFLSLRKQAHGLSWTSMKPTVPPLVACLYCISVIGPLFHTVIGIARTRDWRWGWHLIACPASFLGLFLGTVTYYAGKHSADKEAQLQPRQ